MAGGLSHSRVALWSAALYKYYDTSIWKTCPPKAHISVWHSHTHRQGFLSPSWYRVWVVLRYPTAGGTHRKIFYDRPLQEYQLRHQNQAKLLLCTAGAKVPYQAPSCTLVLMSLPHFIHRRNLWDGVSIIMEEVRLQRWNKFPRGSEQRMRNNCRADILHLCPRLTYAGISQHGMMGY